MKIEFEIPWDCDECQQKGERIREIHKNRRPYDTTKLTLTLTRDVLGRDYWHIHTLEIQGLATRVKGGENE